MNTRLLPVLLLSGLLGACGGEPFHLRGHNPIAVLAQKTVFVQGVAPDSEFGLALHDGLVDAGALMVDKAQDASTVLTIVTVAENRKVSGYSATRQVSELDHLLDVTFFASGKGITDTDKRTVHAERSQVYDNTYVLGTSDEETIIRQDLHREAVRLVLLRLQALQQP